MTSSNTCSGVQEVFQDGGGKSSLAKEGVWGLRKQARNRCVREKGGDKSQRLNL